MRGLGLSGSLRRESHDLRLVRAAVARADALLISTPEYNGSVPGQLKNALDWLSRPYASSVLHGLPVAVVGASTGPFGAVWAQADLRRILGLAGARVLDRDLPVGHAYVAFREDGSLADPAAAATLGGIVRELVERAAAAAGPVAAAA